MNLVYYHETQADSQAPSVVRVDLTEDGEELGVDLHDAYCINPKCPCNQATLAIYRLESRNNAKWDPQVRGLSMCVDLADGKLLPPSKAGPLAERLHRHLQPALDDELLTFLRGRRQHTRKWGELHGWRCQDWNHLEPGAGVGWAEIFPAEAAICLEDWLLDDQYCWTAGCQCNVATLALLDLKAGRVSGYLRHHCLSGKTEVLEGNKKQLLPLLRRFLAQVPELPKTLRDRAAFVARDFAQHLSGSLHSAPLALPSQPIPSAKVGRNDACPCGSGKKYKKCCLA